MTGSLMTFLDACAAQQAAIEQQVLDSQEYLRIVCQREAR